MKQEHHMYLIESEETLARQEIAGVRFGFRNNRRGRIRVEVCVSYDEYDEERDHEVDALSYGTNQWRDHVTYGAASNGGVPGYGAGGAGGKSAGVTIGHPGASHYLTQKTNLRPEEEKAFADAIMHGIGMMRVEQVPINVLYEEADEEFAKRYERAMKLVSP